MAGKSTPINTTGTPKISFKKPVLKTFIDFDKFGLPNLQDFVGLKEPERIETISHVLSKAQHNGLDIALKIYNLLNSMSHSKVKQLDPDLITPEHEYFFILDLKSRKLLLIYHLKKKLYQKYCNEVVDKDTLTWSKYFKNEYKKFNNKMEILSKQSDIIEELLGFEKGIDTFILQYIQTFYQNQDEVLMSDIRAKLYESVPEYGQRVLKEVMEEWGSSKRVIDELFDTSCVELVPNVLSSERPTLSQESVNGNSNLIYIQKNQQDGMFNVNPHFTDLSLDGGLAQYGEGKLRKLYSEVFGKIVNDYTNGFEGVLPVFSDILAYKLSQLDEINKASKIESNYGTLGESHKKQADARIFQHKMVRELPDDFVEKRDLRLLASLIKEIETDFNLNFSPVYKSLDKRLASISDSNFDFIGCFVTNSGLEATNLLIVVDKQTGKKYLNLGLVGANQDTYIYLATQINYYLKYKKFIDKQQLYANIYYQYNKISINENELFDMSIFETQYNSILKDMIYPLSLEYLQEYYQKGIVKNTLLVGLYGTGKSQFLLNLLSKRKYEYNGASLNLNANVVSITIVEFMNMLHNSGGVFQRQLMEIYNNTSLPIILIIEDLDTLVDEHNDGESKNGNGNLMAQALTTFLDGVGSLPVHLLSTTNFPRKLSDRLIRPGRIENIISFGLPLDAKVIKVVLKKHIEKHGLNKSILNYIIKKYLDDMKYFTPSNIANFVKLIKSQIDFNKFLDPKCKFKLSMIDDVFKELLVPVSNISNTQKSINEWELGLKSKLLKQTIGFNKK